MTLPPPPPDDLAGMLLDSMPPPMDLDLTSLMGETVLVVRTLANGRLEKTWLPAGLAVDDLYNNPDNGGRIRSARIVWMDVTDEWSRTP